eukprot:TRINITY_DN12875_c0_g1_i2.p1 TRINITY_DN12875_c0_g1~~TRINITY_DN12875_c0_g1_i2.p1  ORF type:complete len:114 (-),score=13.23 TRINITY_DN12875_c0_g1_i2:114-455(-)
MSRTSALLCACVLALLGPALADTGSELVSVPQSEAEQPAHGLPPRDTPGVSLDDSSGVFLDKLGPLVIHKDGTTSRVGNWHTMDEFDRKRTFRIITARNRKRMKALRRDTLDL